VLRQQLEFIHNQILFVLTSRVCFFSHSNNIFQSAQVHDILASNPSKDVRELLGADTNRLVLAGCRDDVAPPCVVFKATRGFYMERDQRSALTEHLKVALLRSNAAYVLSVFTSILLVIQTLLGLVAYFSKTL
jgi:hypothetical protein